MFAVLKHVYTALFRHEQYQLLIIGLDNAGKTTCLEQFRVLFDRTVRANENLPIIAPTIGFNLTRFVCDLGDIAIWDVGGQSGLRVIWDKYYSDANGIIYVVDAADQERLDEAKAELKVVMGHPDLADAPVLVLANKQDLPDAVSSDTLRTLLGLDEIAVSNAVDVVAVTGDGLVQSLEWLLEQLPGSKRTERLRQIRN